MFRRSNLLLALLILLPGCRAAEREAGAPMAVATPTPAASLAPTPVAPAAVDPLLNSVWVRQDPGAPPGEMRIFLADGTLVMDSCWEVYALRRWRRTGPSELVFEEDVEVPARILALGPDELRLELSLVGSERRQVAYRRADVPYVCPDMAR